LAATACILIFNTAACYYLLRRYSLWRQLLLLPPDNVPGFWEALWDVGVNDTLVRFMVMVGKCILLLVQKQVPGQAFRRQAQALTLIEYASLLYRVILPTSIWYRFFLDEESYGHLFASLNTGLYLTFKLTMTVERLRLLVAAIQAYTQQEMQYGKASTAEEVAGAGDICSICQEDMRCPITLRCRHVFCEACVSEWFEREQTCPLCRAVIKTAGLRSFSDGTTSLFLQVF